MTARECAEEFWDGAVRHGERARDLSGRLANAYLDSDGVDMLAVRKFADRHESRASVSPASIARAEVAALPVVGPIVWLHCDACYLPSSPSGRRVYVDGMAARGEHAQRLCKDVVRWRQEAASPMAMMAGRRP